MTHLKELLEPDNLLVAFSGNGFFASAEKTVRPLPLESIHSDWFFYFAIGIVALLAWSRNFSPYRFFAMLDSFFSYRKTELLHSEGRILRNGTSFGFIITSLLSGGLFAYQLKNLLHIDVGFIDQGPYRSVFYLSLALGVLWLLKAIVARLTGGLFKTPYASSLFLTNTIIINISGGITLFVFTLIYFYTKDLSFLYIPLYLLAFFYIYRMIRGFVIGRKAGGFSILYIILYLCTLEILPVLVLYKFVKDYIFQMV